MSPRAEARGAAWTRALQLLTDNSLPWIQWLLRFLKPFSVCAIQSFSITSFELEKVKMPKMILLSKYLLIEIKYKQPFPYSSALVSIFY